MIRPVNIGDTVLTKDGKTLEVLSIRYQDQNDIQKMEGIDRQSASPMRTVILKDNFRSVIRKAKRVYDADTKQYADLQENGTYVYDKKGA